MLDDKSHSDNENIVLNTHFQLCSVLLVLGGVKYSNTWYYTQTTMTLWWSSDISHCKVISIIHMYTYGSKFADPPKSKMPGFQMTK